MAPMEVCDGYCCVAKRFDRPFRLPSGGSRSHAPTGDTSPAASSLSSSSLIRPGSSSAQPSDSHQRSPCAEELTEDAPCVDDLERPRTPRDGDEDGESREEDAAARMRLSEILDAVVAEAAVSTSSSTDVFGTAAERGGGGALNAFVKAHLGTLAHLSHRRERHCRVILQHAAADRIVSYIADILAGGTSARRNGDSALSEEGDGSAGAGAPCVFFFSFFFFPSATGTSRSPPSASGHSTSHPAPLLPLSYPSPLTQTTRRRESWRRSPCTTYRYARPRGSPVKINA